MKLSLRKLALEPETIGDGEPLHYTAGGSRWRGNAAMASTRSVNNGLGLQPAKNFA